MSIVCVKVNVNHRMYNKWHIFRLWEENIEKLKELTGNIIDGAAEKFEDANLRFTGKIFSLPLTDITSKEDLETKVVNKLLSC